MNEPIKPVADLTDEERQAAGTNADAVRCFRLIAYTSQRLRYLFDRRLREDGLTSQQGFLLTVVRMAGRPTLSEVARSMSATHQNVKQLAVALERKGMLQIVPDGADARAKRLEATGAGQRGWQDRNAGDFAAIADWFGALSASEQKELARLLSRVARTVRDAG